MFLWDTRAPVRETLETRPSVVNKNNKTWATGSLRATGAVKQEKGQNRGKPTGQQLFSESGPRVSGRSTANQEAEIIGAVEFWQLPGAPWLLQTTWAEMARHQRSGPPACTAFAASL